MRFIAGVRTPPVPACAPAAKGPGRGGRSSPEARGGRCAAGPRRAALRLVERTAGQGAGAGGSCVLGWRSTRPALPLRDRGVGVAAVVLVGILAFTAVSELVTVAGAALVEHPIGARSPSGPVVARVAEPGETFWGIGSSYATGDPRPFVDELVRINGGHSELLAGQTVLVPAEWGPR
jgi:hypothetical protein